MEEQKEEVKKGWKIFWIIFDIIFFGIYALYLIILIDPKGTVRFCDGLYDTNYTFEIIFIPFVLWPATSAYFVILFVRLYFWNRYFESKINLWFARIAVMLLLPLVLIISFMPPVRQPGYKTFMAGFHRRMQNRLDIEKTRVWLETLDDELFDGKYYPLLSQTNDGVLPVPIPKVPAPPVTIPKEIRGLSEKIYYLSFYRENKLRCIRIKWGGGLGRWCYGIVIGPEEMKIPASDFCDDGEYRLKLEDGVYVWHSMQ